LSFKRVTPLSSSSTGGAAEMLGIPNIKEVVTGIRLKKRRIDSEITAVQTEITLFKKKISESEQDTEIKIAERTKLEDEKKDLEIELDRLRNSSATVREIHELELLVHQYKDRQAVAEEKKRNQEKQLVEFSREQEMIIEDIRKKKEEIYVMLQIEKIEAKKDVELLKKMMGKYGERIGMEKTFATKANKLGDQSDYPFFQRPVSLPAPVIT